jgi:putative phosphoribosyl transferase
MNGSDGIPFEDRKDAGRSLVRHLSRYRGEDVLVLGIPRGGVPVAAEVARALGAELDVVVARKLGAPGQEELAIGAVTANGGEFVNAELVADLRVSDAYLAGVRREQIAEARRREARFRRGRVPLDLRGRVVLLVDDGLATGATMRAAVAACRGQGLRRLLVAVPVAPRETVEAFRREGVEIVAVLVPEPFFAVGAWYDDFAPTTDDEVCRLLK